MKNLCLFYCVLAIIVPLTNIGHEKAKGCTIGVASGKATADGRPLLWKNRNGKGSDYEVVYCKDGRFKHLVMAPVYDLQRAGGGVNEFGFCIVYSASPDLEGKSRTGVDGGNMMKWALKQCVTVDDFEDLLKQTNVSGRTTACNIGVIDAFGGAAIFETGNHSYTRFDTTDPKVAPQGYIVRANFAFTGSGKGDFSKRIRYARANQLWQQAIEKNELDYRYVLREVCRSFSSHSVTYAALFHGVRPDENPSLTTFWAIMGEPVFSVAVPSWVVAESTAPELDGEEFSPLCTSAKDLQVANYVMDDKGKFLLNPEMLPDIWAMTYPAEDRIFDQTESIMTQWRQDYPAAQQVASFHRSMASEAMNTLQEVTGMLMRKGGPTANLHIALHMRSVERAKAFIEEGPNINVSDGHGYTPLHYAVENNQTEIVELLISKNAVINAKNNSGQNPLDIAIDQNHKEILDLLVANGAEPSSIFIAVRMGDSARVEAFLEEGFNVNARGPRRRTALHIAASEGHKEVVELLLAHGADVNAKDEKNETPLDIALRQNRRSDTVELLLAKGGEFSTIHSAALSGNLEKVRSIIEAGSNLNEKDTWGRTALHCAAIEGHRKVVELLLEKGADVNVGSYYGRTAAEFAMEDNHSDVVELLISKGADISPLHLAISMKDEAKARHLIENGADVTNHTPDGTTPLNRAIGKGLKDIARLLVSSGADVNAGHYWGWTPLHSAAEDGYKEIARLLIAAGADINARDGGGSTPLRYAEKEGHSEIVELLKKHRAKE